MRRLLIGILASIALQAMPLQAAPITEIIPVQHAAAEGLLPVIRPLLQEDERVSAYGNQLVVRAEPDRIRELQRLVNDLDQRPTRLRISVASAGGSRFDERGAEVHGRVSGGPVDLTVGDPANGSRTRIIRRQTLGSTDGVRQITALEGSPVLIQQGQSVPLTTTTSNAWGQTVEQIQYRDVVSGFYATVRLNGDIATIDLQTSDDRVNPSNDRRLDVRRTDSVVTARLGEWVTVGNLGDATSARDSDVGRRTTTRREDTQTIRIMVERLE